MAEPGRPPERDQDSRSMVISAGNTERVIRHLQTVVADHPPIALDRHADQRQDQRYQLNQFATVTVLGTASQILYGEIRNVSSGGTQIGLDQPLRYGSLVTIDYDDNRLLGEVVYCEKEHAGWLVGIRVEPCWDCRLSPRSENVINHGSAEEVASMKELLSTVATWGKRKRCRYCRSTTTRFTRRLHSLSRGSRNGWSRYASASSREEIPNAVAIALDPKPRSCGKTNHPVPALPPAAQLRARLLVHRVLRIDESLEVVVIGLLAGHRPPL